MVPIIQIEIPNCPYNSKQLSFLVKAVRERVGLRSIIYPPPPDIHISAYDAA